MNKVLVERWNSVVEDDDTIWHLGDVFFRDYSMLHELKGKKILILGNHDMGNVNKLKEFFSIHPRDIVTDSNIGLVMSHYPIYDWPNKFHGWAHIHGHSHGTKYYDPRAVDIGVDCWDYMPVRLEQITAEIKKRERPTL
jgi:calcineurin-like phosphoesterase family protein